MNTEPKMTEGLLLINMGFGRKLPHCEWQHQIATDIPIARECEATDHADLDLLCVKLINMASSTDIPSDLAFFCAQQPLRCDVDRTSAMC
jgi:hypothetical protein